LEEKELNVIGFADESSIECDPKKKDIWKED
jgi:hypothetical protein